VDAFRHFFRRNRSAHLAAVRSPRELQVFLQTRASLVSQHSLYGYLRTRAGTRFPELFENEAFLRSTNIAKWQIWLACLSDLAAYSGGLLYRRGRCENTVTGSIVTGAAGAVLAALGTPTDADARAFAEAACGLQVRLQNTDWAAVEDGEGPFSKSPGALVHWAPVVDDLKALDEEIVTNSIRFRWQEVRRELRKKLHAEALIGAHLAQKPAKSP